MKEILKRYVALMDKVIKEDGLVAEGGNIKEPWTGLLVPYYQLRGALFSAGWIDLGAEEMPLPVPGSLSSRVKDGQR